MNKKKYGIIAAIAIVIIAIGAFMAVKANKDGKVNYEKNQYVMAMSAGKDAVDAKDYKVARQDFKRASELKPGDTKANAYAEQADHFVSANKNIKDFDFEDAIEDLQEVGTTPNGYKVMNDQARKLTAKLQEVQDNIENEIKPLQQEAADAANNKDYAGAVAAYDKILALDYINGKYYKKIFQETKAARTEADNIAKAAQNSSSSDVNMNNEGATEKDKEVNGKEITADMIAKARADVQALGINPAPWSNLDISRLIQISVANNHDKITQEDIDQFLK